MKNDKIPLRPRLYKIVVVSTSIFEFSFFDEAYDRSQIFLQNNQKILKTIYEFFLF